MTFRRLKPCPKCGSTRRLRAIAGLGVEIRCFGCYHLFSWRLWPNLSYARRVWMCCEERTPKGERWADGHGWYSVEDADE